MAGRCRRGVSASKVTTDGSFGRWSSESSNVITSQGCASAVVSMMLLHLPDGYKPEQVRDALAAKIKTLPDSLRLSLTWDQGPEMRGWEHVSVDAGIEIYFCDPHAPWLRGTN